jgi:hypothetical protein
VIGQGQGQGHGHFNLFYMDEITDIRDLLNEYGKMLLKDKIVNTSQIDGGIMITISGFKKVFRNEDGIQEPTSLGYIQLPANKGNGKIFFKKDKFGGCEYSKDGVNWVANIAELI